MVHLHRLPRRCVARARCSRRGAAELRRPCAGSLQTISRAGSFYQMAVAGCPISGLRRVPIIDPRRLECAHRRLLLMPCDHTPPCAPSPVGRSCRCGQSTVWGEEQPLCSKAVCDRLSRPRGHNRRRRDRCWAQPRVGRHARVDRPSGHGRGRSLRPVVHPKDQAPSARSRIRPPTSPTAAVTGPGGRSLMWSGRQEDGGGTPLPEDSCASGSAWQRLRALTNDLTGLANRALLLTTSVREPDRPRTRVRSGCGGSRASTGNLLAEHNVNGECSPRCS